VSTPTSVDPLADRYGRQPSGSRRRGWLVVGGLAALVAFGWLVWAVVASSGGVTHTEVAFRVLGDNRVEVTYDVAMDAGSRAVCTLQAFDVQHRTVGLRAVDVGPTDARVTRQVSTVQTSALAAAAVVRDCVPRT